MDFNFSLSDFSKVIKLTLPSNMLLSLVVLKLHAEERRVNAFVKFPSKGWVYCSPWRGARYSLSLNVGEIYGEIFYLHF